MVLGSAPPTFGAGSLAPWPWRIDSRLSARGELSLMLGGLMSYSTDIKDAVYRSAYLVDRVLKGAKAAELPFEQTTNINLVVNMKVAEALKITIPQSVLLRADEVIR